MFTSRMQEEATPPEASLALASASAASTTTTTEAGARLLRPGGQEALSSWRVTASRRTGQLALGAIILATLAVVACAAAGSSILVPRSIDAFPDWEAGPLHGVTVRLITNPQALGYAFTGILALMLVAYAVVMAAIRTFSMRTIAITVVLLHAILLLSPPLQLTDVFNYLGYARLGGLHHLNPYTHVIKQEAFDPVFLFSSWHSLRSPYGELFTTLSYPLAFLPLAIAYWLLKAVTVLLSLACVWLTWLCARRLGHDPRYAVAFVAFNPIFLIYAVGGFHNDFFMLVPSMAAIALVLSGRDRCAGASLIIAIGIKFTAVIIAPFLLLALVTRARRRRFIAGALIALVPLLAVSLGFFGTSVPNLQQQSSLLTQFSIPNLVGLIGGMGPTPLLLKLATVCVILVVAYHFFVRRGPWLVGAGWSTVALILSLAWLVPWYIIWLLPLAALSPSARLRHATMMLTVFLIATFAPATTTYFSDHSINPLHTPPGEASQSLQSKLAG